MKRHKDRNWDMDREQMYFTTTHHLVNSYVVELITH